jgi:hypothetical protein
MGIVKRIAGQLGAVCSERESAQNVKAPRRLHGEEKATLDGAEVGKGIDVRANLFG